MISQSDKTHANMIYPHTRIISTPEDVRRITTWGNQNQTAMTTKRKARRPKWGPLAGIPAPVRHPRTKSKPGRTPIQRR